MNWVLILIFSVRQVMTAFKENFNCTSDLQIHIHIIWKNKKRTFRALWIQRINAGARLHGMSYSKFMGKILKSDIQLNRKVLADLAMNHPESFKKIVEKIK